MMWSVVLFTPFVLCLVCSAQLTMTPASPVHIKENLSDILLFNGTYIWQDTSCSINAVQGQNSDPSVQISTNYTVSPGTCIFNVILLSPVDYEKTTLLNIKVILSQECSGIVTQTIAAKLIFISNVMDTPPAFTHDTYSVSIQENHKINTTILANIQAIDADGSDTINYTVNFRDLQKNLFQVRHQSNPEILDIYLISPLDFEQQHIHHFTITATDTAGMNSTCEVAVKVINIQDTPPAFTAIQYNGRINEEAKMSSVVLTVSAIDGDSIFTQDQWEGTTANQIYYSIINGDIGMFGINSSTGEIITIRQLDIDNNNNVTNGLVVLTIMAEELNTSREPQFGVSNVTVLVLVQIEDANDNRPQFNSQSFSGSIRADAAMGELITIESGGYISVFDIDQAPSNNHFSLHIEKDGQPWNIFKPNIEAQYAYASVMIQLNKNNSLLDLGDTHIKFQIVVQEYENSSMNFLPTKSEMTVWVKARVVVVTPGSVINLPLSTSDIIVFVVGFLLLLNVSLTAFVCFMLGGWRGFFKRGLNRNSKYYVSNRNNTNPENDETPNTTVHGAELCNTNTSKRGSGMTAVDMSAVRVDEQTHINANTTQVMKADRSAGDRNDIDQAQDTETSRQLSTDTVSSQVKAQIALMSILKENDSLNYHVKPYKSPTSQNNYNPQIAGAQQDQCINDQSNVRQGLSNFMQQVQQKLANRNKHEMGKKDCDLDLQHQPDASIRLELSPSETPDIHPNHFSSSKKISGDGMPLIRPSRTKCQINIGNLLPHKNSAYSTADLPATGEEVKEFEQQNSIDEKLALPSDKETEALVSDSSSKEEAKMKKIMIFKSQDKNSVKKSAYPPNSNINSDTRVYPTASQITQTGVPPVALAFPHSVGTLNINKVPQVGTINPVFGTSSAADKLTANSFLISPASAAAPIIYHPQPSPIDINQSTTQKTTLQILSSTVSTKDSITENPKSITQEIPNLQPHLSLESQDYASAAKDVLASIKKDRQINEMKQPKTVTINEDATQRQTKQNILEDKRTSF